MSEDYAKISWKWRKDVQKVPSTREKTDKQNTHEGICCSVCLGSVLGTVGVRQGHPGRPNLICVWSYIDWTECPWDQQDLSTGHMEYVHLMVAIQLWRCVAKYLYVQCSPRTLWGPKWLHTHFYYLGINFPITQDICYTGLSGRIILCNSGPS